MASSPPFGINELEDVLAWTLEFSIVIGWKMDLIVSQGNNYYFVIEMFEFFLKIETRGEILFIRFVISILFRIQASKVYQFKI